MKKLLYPALALCLFAGSAFVTLTATKDYTFKEGFTISFKSKDPSGEFKKAKGTITFDENELDKAKFDISVDVSSINTGNSMQNKKAQISEWFDGAKYPNIKFVSSKVEKTGDNYTITGKLTMKGVTKDKKIQTTVSKSASGLTFSGKFTVNRIDYGVGEKSDAVPDLMNISYSIPVSEK
jgi:polyisoprenoid-binding protein YceI